MKPADPATTDASGAARDTASSETLEEMNRLWTIAKAFSTAAHDVNNALQVISGSAELLGGRTDLDAVVQRRIEAVRVQAGKAAVTIDRLLTYSRASGTSAQRIDLGDLVDAAVAMRACSLGRARISVAVTRSDDQPYMVAGDRHRLLQLLLNVLLSFEAILTGRQNSTIGIRLERRPGTLAIAATAAGSGPIPTDGPNGPSLLTSDSDHGAPLWAAARLAAAQSGSFSVEERDGVAHATLEMKSV